MATVTPNFNWPVPTSTDLVKDGATAIEALGDSIDASLVDLKGGTTGQVLSKNSNTDMDFVWVTDAAGDITGVTAGTGISGGGTSGTVTVTNSMATAIDAKGDLVPGTGADTFTRLAVGANGTILTADSAETTGLKWAAPAITLINTTTFSTVSAQTIDSLFSSTYDNYKIIINITACSVADVDLYAQFRSGGSNVTTNNTTEVITQYSTGITGAERSNLIVFGQISTNYPRFVNQTIDVLNPFLSATTTVSVNGGYVTNAGVPYQFRAFGYNNSTTSMTGINIYPSSGTISGTIRIYGLRNS